MDRQEVAETLALRALAWVLSDGAARAAFLAATGAAPRDLAGIARDPAGLGAVLDVLLSDEPRLLACAAALGAAPGALAAAREALPGGAAPHWT